MTDVHEHNTRAAEANLCIPRRKSSNVNLPFLLPESSEWNKLSSHIKLMSHFISLKRKAGMQRHVFVSAFQTREDENGKSLLHYS